MVQTEICEVCVRKAVDDVGVKDAERRNPGKEVYRDGNTGKVGIAVGRNTGTCKLIPKEEFMAKAQLKILNDEIEQIKKELGPAIIEHGKDGIRVKILLKNAESAIAKKEMIERALWG